MDNIYFLILIALVVLAVIDLVVGVSNDAVNFLNSAIGSKALSFKTILILASLGVLFGSVFSSGLMEVARKGIFNPEMYYFNEIMFIFLAVMITDVLLLDFFNNLGLPTSTTVSIVFELLGAGVFMALIKISASDIETISNITDYINTKKAGQIILGIVLSVIIAFSIGAFVQWISRILFTFQYENRFKNFGFIFGGIALSSIGYFIIYKGLKGTPFYGNIKDIIKEYNVLIIIGSFLIWSLFSFLYQNVLKKNILILIIGVGTFALALAFAGNDLVNFIGVPMAALHSYEAWSISGLTPDKFDMGVLSEKVSTKTIYLIIAGLIMSITLWISSKARNVVETEIGLARQGDGSEKFSPNMLSRGIVKGSNKLVSLLGVIIPKATQMKIESSFEKPNLVIPKQNRHLVPAFDLIRASVNLMLAGILISVATSMKLPLSTTYVTFMVAMGTSLADRAWGRDSAVYRVAGVVNVIGGWFVTAMVAFLVAGIVVYILHIGNTASVAVLLILVIVVLTRNYIIHNKKYKEKIAKKIIRKETAKTLKGIINESVSNITNVIDRTKKTFNEVIIGLETENENRLLKSIKGVKKLDLEIEELRDNIFYFIKELEENGLKGSRLYITILYYLTDVTQSFQLITKSSHKHVRNNHKKLKSGQIEELREVQKILEKLLDDIYDIFEKSKFEDIIDILNTKKDIDENFSEKIDKQIKRTREVEQSPKNTTLYFNILLESYNLVQAILNLMEAYHNNYEKTKDILNSNTKE